MIITIDGPSASGKSTLAQMLAKELGFFYLNSGYLYRGIAYVLVHFYHYDVEKLQQVNIEDVKACFENNDFKYKYENGVVRVEFGDIMITQHLKDVRVAKYAAIIAKNPEVRSIIRNYKRKIVADKDTVGEGRVLGSVVFPDAEIKFFVTASPEVRAVRNYNLQKSRGSDITLEQVALHIRKRDAADMTREHDPLVQPEGAIVIDTTNLSKAEMLHKALLVVRKNKM